MDEYPVNLLRMLIAEQWASLSLAAAREMFGKSYYALGQLEKVQVDQAVLGQISANYNTVTPEWLAGTKPPAPQPVGFQAPPPATKA